MARQKPTAAGEHTYNVLLQPEPEGGYTVICPSLPGLVTCGETLEEARAMAAEAIEAYLESLQIDGEPIPESDVAEPGVLAEAARVRLGRGRGAGSPRPEVAPRSLPSSGAASTCSTCNGATTCSDVLRGQASAWSSPFTARICRPGRSEASSSRRASRRRSSWTSSKRTLQPPGRDSSRSSRAVTVEVEMGRTVAALTGC